MGVCNMEIDIEAAPRLMDQPAPLRPADLSCIPAFSGLPVERLRPRWRCCSARGVAISIDWQVGLSPADLGESPLDATVALPLMAQSADDGLYVEAHGAGSSSAACVYLVLPTIGTHPQQRFDWRHALQTMQSDLRNEPTAQSAYTALLTRLLSPFIPVPELAWQQMRWCDADELRTLLVAQRCARMLLHTANSIGADLTLYCPVACAETLIESWQSEPAFKRRLANTLAWLPAVDLRLLLPCAHMSAQDFHRIRNGYVIRLAMVSREGEGLAVPGFAMGGDAGGQSGWCPMAWNISVCWEEADSSDQFLFRWSQPVHDMDDLRPFVEKVGQAGQAVGFPTARTPVDLPGPDDRVALVLECVLGTQSYRLEDLLQIRPGELLSFTGWQWPVVTLRLSGKTLGVGELVLCGDELAVQVTQWHPSETDDEQSV